MNCAEIIKNCDKNDDECHVIVKNCDETIKNYDEIMFSDSQEEENRWESPM